MLLTAPKKKIMEKRHNRVSTTDLVYNVVFTVICLVII